MVFLSCNFKRIWCEIHTSADWRFCLMLDGQFWARSDLVAALCVAIQRVVQLLRWRLGLWLLRVIVLLYLSSLLKLLVLLKLRVSGSLLDHLIDLLLFSSLFIVSHDLFFPSSSLLVALINVNVWLGIPWLVAWLLLNNLILLLQGILLLLLLIIVVSRLEPFLRVILNKVPFNNSRIVHRSLSTYRSLVISRYLSLRLQVLPRAGWLRLWNTSIEIVLPGHRLVEHVARVDRRMVFLEQWIVDVQLFPSVSLLNVGVDFRAIVEELTVDVIGVSHTCFWVDLVLTFESLLVPLGVWLEKTSVRPIVLVSSEVMAFGRVDFWRGSLGQKLNSGVLFVDIWLVLKLENKLTIFKCLINDKKWLLTGSNCWPWRY